MKSGSLNQAMAANYCLAMVAFDDLNFFINSSFEMRLPCSSRSWISFSVRAELTGFVFMMIKLRKSKMNGKASCHSNIS